MFTGPYVGNRAEMVIFRGQTVDTCCNTPRLVFIDQLDTENGFPCVEDRASWEHGGLSRSFVCHSFPSLYGHVHLVLLHWCLDVSYFHLFKALTSLKTAFRFPPKPEMLSPAICNMLEFIRWIWQWIYYTCNSALVRAHLDHWDPQCKTGICWNEFSERKISLRDWSIFHMRIC